MSAETTHTTNPALLDGQAVDVYVAGAGGTGSLLLTLLTRLHISLRSLGHPYGLNVHLYDPKDVSPANIGRQAFYPDDVGRNKADVLIDRLAHHHHRHEFRNWHGHDAKLEDIGARTGVLISCVDSRRSRAALPRTTTYYDREEREDVTAPLAYTIDCGNAATHGQVVLGGSGIPHPYDTFPQLADTSLPDDDTPSCSLEQALESQDLFVNLPAANIAANILWQLLRHGRIDHRGAYYNTTTNTQTPIPLP